MVRITGIRHAWREAAGFRLVREKGHPDYSFVHFTKSAEVVLNGERYVVPEHTCLVYRPGTPHYIFSPTPFIHDWFHFTDTTDEELAELGIPLDTFFYPLRWSFITDAVGEMEIEFFAGREHRERLLALKTEEFWIKLSRACRADATETVGTETYRSLEALRGRVAENMGRRWTVADMAAELSFSPSRFYAIYRAAYGTSPVDDLIRTRIDAAKNALIFSERTIFDIACSLGYENVTHFCRQFKKQVGISPSQYRKNGLRD